MAAGRIVLSQYFPARDRNARLVSGALLYVYTNGTTTKASIFSNEGLTTALANPVAANSSGQFPAIWADDAVTYTLSITAADGSSIGNPSVFDDYSVSTDYDAATAAIAEAAAAAAQEYYEDILALEGEADPSIAIATRAAKAANLSDLADGDAALGNLDFIQAGTGAVTRTAKDKMRDILSANDHGTLQQTITAAGFLGGEVELPSGEQQSVTGAAAEACLTTSSPVSLIGKGGTYSAITPDGSTAADAATLRITPSSSVEGGLFRLQNIYFGNYENGTREGGTGIHIRTVNSAATADRILLDGVFVGGSGDLGFHHENLTSANPTGGVFCSEFRRSAFVGGMKFDDTGDSLLFTTITTTGPGIGVEFEGTISAAGDGPSQALFLNHNSTSEDGAFLFHRARFPTVQNANMEQTVVNTGGRVVDFAGDTKPNNSTGIWAPVLSNSLVAGFTSVGLASFVRFGSVSGGYVWNNAFLDGGAAATADIVIDSGATGVWVGPNLSLRSNLIITDNGVGTRGVNKTPTKANGWVDVGGAETLQIMKSLDGVVHVWGVCANGTTTGGTTVFTLPVGFRPVGYFRPLIAVNDAGSFDVPGTLLILDTGEVQITFVPTAGGAAAQQLHFAFSFRAANANTIQIPEPFVV